MKTTSMCVAAVLLLAPSAATADPCGMVPPVERGPGRGIPITRIGAQKTYVFHRRGIESIVIRPGFKGSVGEFGMLIPFPSPPAMRKVPDQIFAHIAAAVDPPEIVVKVEKHIGGGIGGGGFGGGGVGGYIGAPSLSAELKRDEVRVIRKEAVGMYEAAVLAAGSAKALNRWMKEHGFRYPKGMDAVCDDYVKQRWCFVAVKARVGVKALVDPKPGQRKVETKLPAGFGFDGHVQAMAFRFRSRELIVPMRLSAFNKGDLRNIVYLLTDQPVAILGLPTDLVRRQITGTRILRNLFAKLPVRVIGAKSVEGRFAIHVDGGKVRLNIPHDKRKPQPKNGLAGELFAADMQASSKRRLTLPSESSEKSLVQISEQLGLRGPEIDTMIGRLTTRDRTRELRRVRLGLKRMILTVIDGDLPRDYIAENNLRFRRFAMNSESNTREDYDSTIGGPPKERFGILLSGDFRVDASPSKTGRRVVAADTERTADGSNGRSLVAFAMLAGIGVIGLVVLGLRKPERASPKSFTVKRS